MNLFKRLIASFSMPSRLPVPQQSSVELGMARSCGCWGAPIRRAVVRSFPRATALRAFHLFCQGQLIREACGTSALFAGGLYRRAQCCLLDVRNRALFSRFLSRHTLFLRSSAGLRLRRWDSGHRLRLGSGRSSARYAGRDFFQVRSAASSLAARSVNENGVVVICVAGWEHRGKIYHYRLGSVVEYTVHTARRFREGTASGIYVERCPAPFIFGEGSADDYAPNRPRVEMPGKGLSGGEGDLKHRDDLAAWERAFAERNEIECAGDIRGEQAQR